MADSTKGQVAAGKLNDVLKKVVDDLELSHLRKIRGETYECASKCCRDSLASRDNVQQCIDGCNAKMETAEHCVNNELEKFQYRFQLCISQCSLELRDRLTDNPSQEEITVYNNLFQSCVSSCVDTVLMHVPDMVKRLHSKLNKDEDAFSNASIKQLNK